jgi:hypothetical protein
VNCGCQLAKNRATDFVANTAVENAMDQAKFILDRIEARWTLTVWFLISKGHQAVAAHFNDEMEGIELGMTIAVPMEFLNHQKLKATFLSPSFAIRAE